jgi:DNA invertase Pin-like site-specific DNA recombinase
LERIPSFAVCGARVARLGAPALRNRLGRSLTDLLGILQDLHEKGVVCFSISRALIPRPPPERPCSRCWVSSPSSIEGSFRERVNAGLARAKANGTKLGRRRGRPNANSRTEGQRRRDPQDRPQARHRHERGAARFQARAAAIVTGYSGNYRGAERTDRRGRAHVRFYRMAD